MPRVVKKKATFLADKTRKRADVRRIECIGAAISHIPEPLRQNYPMREWRAIAGMRDRRMQRYFGVDDAIGCNV
jgi:uncharacterized protein with HEPN domain